VPTQPKGFLNYLHKHIHYHIWPRNQRVGHT